MKQFLGTLTHRCTVTLAIHALGRDEAVQLYGESDCALALPVRAILAWLGRLAIAAAAVVAMLASSPLVSAPARPDNRPVVIRHDRWLTLEYSAHLNHVPATTARTAAAAPLSLGITTSLLEHSRFLLDHDLAGR